jgi:hypothetical protein
MPPKGRVSASQDVKKDTTVPKCDRLLGKLICELDVDGKAAFFKAM